MDTSEQYIKQCEKALPDIGCHGWQDGDFAYRNGKVKVFHQKAADNMGWQTGDQCIPLYRQDQLQGIYVGLGKGFNGYPLAEDFWLFWAQHKSYCQDKNLRSFEQLWLAFVMKERYGKVWVNGEEWIRED